MTLNEAIDRSESIARTCKDVDKALYHKQLAEWLRELKERQKGELVIKLDADKIIDGVTERLIDKKEYELANVLQLARGIRGVKIE